jgi:hypothetical protein
VRTRADLALALLRTSGGILIGNLKDVTLDEALSAAGGYRSVLGILKHAAGWSHVYHSYAFDESPKHWPQTEWPRGLRDTIEPSQDYYDEIVAWLKASFALWEASLKDLPDEEFDAPHPAHWGMPMPLFNIIVIIATHFTYHAGELNEVLAIVRGHAWEYSEEVEENHISTAGHRLRPGWMNDDEAARYEVHMKTRDAELSDGKV